MCTCKILSLQSPSNKNKIYLLEALVIHVIYHVFFLLQINRVQNNTTDKRLSKEYVTPHMYLYRTSEITFSCMSLIPKNIFCKVKTNKKTNWWTSNTCIWVLYCCWCLAPLSSLCFFFFFNNNIFLFKMLVTFLLQKPKLLMKYFILIFSYIIKMSIRL